MEYLLKALYEAKHKPKTQYHKRSILEASTALADTRNYPLLVSSTSAHYIESSASQQLPRKHKP